MGTIKKDLNFHVYLGTVRGGLIYSQCKKDAKTKYELKDLNGEVTALEWTPHHNRLVSGDVKGHVRIYNTASEKYTSDISDAIEGEGPVVGLGCYGKKIIVGRRNGIVNVWSKKENAVFNLGLNDDSTVECLEYNRERNVIATGGEKNDLKVWDVEGMKPIFKAKSMGHDELNLPIPTTSRGICFFPSEQNLVACATKEGHVLLYDERAQRRPVTKYHEPKASFTCAATAYRDRKCFVGTTKGYVQLVDLRQNKCLKTLTSFTGGITSIVCDSVEPFVATACLDRHLRIHNFETKEIVHKEYLKLGLTKLLMKPIVKEESDEEEQRAIEDVTNVSAVDDEYEKIFDNMDEVADDNDSVQKGKKRKVSMQKKRKKKLKLAE